MRCRQHLIADCKRHGRYVFILEVGKPTCFRNIVSGAKQSIELPIDTQQMEIELACDVTEAPEALPTCDGEKTTLFHFSKIPGKPSFVSDGAICPRVFFTGHLHLITFTKADAMESFT